MHTDGRIRDLIRRVEFEGDEYNIIYCWRPIDDPNSHEVFPRQIVSDIDKPFYEIYKVGTNRALLKVFNDPSEEDVRTAKYTEKNRIATFWLAAFIALPFLLFIFSKF